MIAKRKSNKGFSLVEVVIALAVLTFGAYGIYASFFDSGRQGHGIDVANIHQFATAGVRLNGGKMVLRNASASHECEADGAAGDGRVAVHGVLTG